MKKYIITVECIETYEVVANSEEEACEKADEMFEKADHTIYVEDEEEQRERVLVTRQGAGRRRILT